MAKKYIIKATAEIETTLETDAPECAAKLLEDVLRDVCDISAKVSNVCLKGAVGTKGGENEHGSE